MIDRAVLHREIETLPEICLHEVVDFLADIKLKHSLKKTYEYASEAEGYQAMAADIEREMEADEWCSAYFGPIHSK